MTDRQDRAHAWLNRNYIEWREVQKLKLRLELSESMLSNGVSQLTRSEVQTDHAGNPQEEKTINASFLRQQVEDRLKSLDFADGLTIKIIGMIDDAEFRYILISRYILRESWTKIEKESNFSRRTMFRIWHQALDAASEKINSNM